MSAAEPGTVHEDVAGYALGVLAPQERERFEAHLAAGCPTCRTELEELAPVAARLSAAGGPLPAPPRSLRAATLAAVERAAAPSPNGAAAPAARPARPAPARRRGPRRGLRFAFAAAAVAAILAALLVGRSLTDDAAAPGAPGGAPGPLEAVATLEAPGGGGQASLDVFFTGIGRVVAFDTDDLPILPKSEYYELWFVGPGDRPGAPNRISAGTFHPDEDGRSKVTFAAAVDPRKYPTLAVSAEPGDGNPAPTRPDVLRGESRLLDPTADAP